MNERIWRWLGTWNNLLLIPLFTIMVLETGVGISQEQQSTYRLVNLAFCASFFAEWLAGFVLATDRKAYLKNPAYGIDLISSIPFSYVFQGLRIARLFRVVRILRLAFRARRFRGRGAALVRAAGIVGATVFAGAIALRTVEPATCPSFGDALWWALVTVSTVGYGDISPATQAGRSVAAVLIFFGIGVFGYIAAFMTSVMADPDEDEILMTVRRIEARLDAMDAGDREG